MRRELDDPRRRLLVQALALGLILPGDVLAQSLLGKRPVKLPPGQSVYRVGGDVTVNDKPANLQTQINAGDTVKTAKGAEIIFVVGSNAMIARGGTTVVIEKEQGSMIVRGLRMLAGALLSVSRGNQMAVTTLTASIGVRGTGFYVEAEPDQTYFCTCYGVTEVASSADPQASETIAASHHDRPVYILKDAGRGKNIRNAPFINHTDQELALIEALVGRTPPFVFPKDSYSGPRKDY